MEKLTMVSLLETVKNSASPVGAAYLSKHLDSSSATIGRMMKQAEEKGYLTSVSNKGRILTSEGEKFLNSQNEQVEILQNAEEVIALVFSEEVKHAIDILEFRRLIEPYAVSRAVMNITDVDLEEIKDLDFEHRYMIRKGESGAEQDLKLHLKLAELSGNQVLFHVLKLILTENNMYKFFASVGKCGEAGSYADHESIIEALWKRDAKAAAQAMEKHLTNLISLVSNK